jgi:hypothetical protein
VANGNGTALAVQGLSTALVTVNCTVACTGGTAVTFQVSQDGANYFQVFGQQVGVSATLSTSVINQGTNPTLWLINISGAQLLRAPISSYSAGTVTVTATATAGSASPSAVGVISTPNVTVPILVQSASAVSTSSAANIQPVFKNVNTLGNSIVASCGIGNGTTATVTDSNSNTYALALNEPNSTAFSSQIFIAVNVKAGANTVTIAPSSATSAACAIYEFNGFITATNIAGGTVQAAIIAVDQTNGAIATGTAVLSGPVGTLVPNEFAVVAVSVGTGTSTFGAVTPGFNTDYSVNSAGTASGLFSFLSGSAYLPVSTSVNSAVTLGTSRPWAAAIVSFKSVILPVESVGPTTSPAVGISIGNLTANTTAASIKATAGNLYGWAIGNPNTTACYLQFFNTSSVTLGTTTELLDVLVPASATSTGGNNYTLPFPLSFSTAIYVASTTAAHGASTCGTGMNVAIFYE